MMKPCAREISHHTAARIAAKVGCGLSYQALQDLDLPRNAGLRNRRLAFEKRHYRKPDRAPGALQSYLGHRRKKRQGRGMPGTARKDQQADRLLAIRLLTRWRWREGDTAALKAIANRLGPTSR